LGCGDGVGALERGGTFDQVAAPRLAGLQRGVDWLLDLGGQVAGEDLGEQSVAAPAGSGRVEAGGVEHARTSRPPAVLPGARGQTCFDETVEWKRVVLRCSRTCAATSLTPKGAGAYCNTSRSYGVVGSVAVVVALGTGTALLRGSAWDATRTAATVLAVIRVLALPAGVAQARRMTQLCQAALAAPADLRLARRVRRGARSAMVLRAALGMLSVALIALGSLLATDTHSFCGRQHPARWLYQRKEYGADPS
jgi:hypothetical protein